MTRELEQRRMSPEVVSLDENFQLFAPNRTIVVSNNSFPSRLYTAVELPLPFDPEKRIPFTFKAVTPILIDFARAFTPFDRAIKGSVDRLAKNPLQLTGDTGQFGTLQHRGLASAKEIYPDAELAVQRLRLQLAIPSPTYGIVHFESKPSAIFLPELVGFTMDQFYLLEGQEDMGRWEEEGLASILLPDNRKKVEKIQARFVLKGADDIPLDSLI